MIFILSIATFAAAFIGGLFALRFKDKLHLILGFSAGSLIGVVLFDLVPEAIELSQDIDKVMLLVTLGFSLYLILDRTMVLHFDGDEEGHSHRGRFGAGGVLLHSFLDGAALGVALQVSTLATIAVAIAVLTHRFSDGINTVSLLLKGGSGRSEAVRWLLGVSISPVLGIGASFFFSLPESILGVLLSLFAGFFLYIGVGELLPESHHRHPTYLTTLSTILGILVLFVVVRVAGL